MSGPTRKSEGGPGSTPQPKHPKKDDQDEYHEAEDFSDDITEKEMIKQMWNMMKEMKKDTSQVKLETRLATEAAESANIGVKEVKQTMKGIQETVKKLQEKDTAIDKDISEMKAAIANKTKTHEVMKNNNPEEEVCRELQVIIKGLTEPQDEDLVLKQVNEVIESLGARGKCSTPFVFTDPSRIGVIQFRTVAAKIGFFKKANGSEKKWSNGEDMRFTSNDTIEKRTTDKELGLIKYQLTTVGGLNQKEVKIKWKKETIEVKGKCVAWVSQDRTIGYAEEAETVKATVKQLLKEWKSKRSIE